MILSPSLFIFRATTFLGFLFLSALLLAQKPTKLYLTAKDGLQVVAQNYQINDSATYIILCHQAGWNKKEYAQIAPKLNTLGFNCLALDLRSGGSLDGSPNETNNMALRKGVGTGYLDAKQDIEAAIDYLTETHKRPVIVFGSSYSASLALMLGCHYQHILAVAAFSPGEYFGEKVKLAEQLEKCTIPAFVTGSKDEREALIALYKHLTSKEKAFFIPTLGEGRHGASALWNDNENAFEYWSALENFLLKYTR